jgi:hypothetical protein
MTNRSGQNGDCNERSTRGAQGFAELVRRCSRGHDVVHQQQPRIAKIGVVLYGKRGLHVVAPFPRSQFGLRACCPNSFQQTIDEWQAKSIGNLSGDYLGGVMSVFALAGPMGRNRRDSFALQSAQFGAAHRGEQSPQMNGKRAVYALLCRENGVPQGAFVIAKSHDRRELESIANAMDAPRCGIHPNANAHSAEPARRAVIDALQPAAVADQNVIFHGIQFGLAGDADRWKNETGGRAKKKPGSAIRRRPCGC